MHSALHIKPGFVPSPNHWYSFLTGAKGPLPASWQRITSISAVQPGDYFLFTSSPYPTPGDPFQPASSTTDVNRRFVGHAVIAAGPPTQLTDDSYVLRVFDSTGATNATVGGHGCFDTIHTNPANINFSGLGNGTMRLYKTSGTVTSVAWSIEASGPFMSGVQVAVGRARN